MTAIQPERSLSTGGGAVARFRQSRPFRPVPHETLIVVTAAVALVTSTFSSGSLPGWMPPLWVDTNAIPRDAVLLVGPLVAGIGAWIGGIRHTAAVGALAARGWSRIALAQLGPIAACVIVGGFVGIVPALVRGVGMATAGNVSPLIIMSGWLAGLVLLAAGYALGVAWSSRIAVIVAVVGAFVIVVAPSWLNDVFAGDLDAGTSGTSFFSVALVWLDFAAGPGQREVLAATLERLLFFAAVLGATLMAIGRLGSPEQDRRRLGALVPFLVPFAIGSVLLLKQPDLVLPTTAPETCLPVTGSVVCVARDVEAALPAFSAGAERVVAVFGFGGLQPEVLRTTPLSDFVFVGLAETERSLENEAAIATARAVAGMSVCEILAVSDADISQGGSLANSYSLSADLAYVLALKSGVPQSELDTRLFVTDQAAIDSLSQLENNQIRNFLDEHPVQLQSCSLTTLESGE